MDKNTFGNTPAAMYLAEYLTIKNDQSETRKVSRKLASFNRTIAELENSNTSGQLSAHVIGNLIMLLREDIISSNVCLDTHASNLVANVMMGKLKELTRKVTSVRHIEQKSSKSKVGSIKLYMVTDPKNSDVLIEKSSKRLTRLGKQNTLYPTKNL